MGIRFYCPNGHKLNVKSFLAGKRGICPHCGTKVDIPLESTRESGKQKDKAPAGNSPMAVPISGPGAGGVSKPVPMAQPAPMARPAGAAQGNVPMAQPVAGAATQQRPAATQPIAGLSSTPQAAAAAQPAAFPAQPAPAPAPAMPDPIAEAPQAVWYVRPSSGGQYGPATGDIMQQWINEGRVAADSLVWREGWPDWKNAGQTFPKFAATAGGAIGQGWPVQGSPF